MNTISLGTCGWSYTDWAGVFSSAKAPAGDFLGYYAEHYSIVEVDSSFYRTPTPRMVESWFEKTPDNFRFSLKVPQVITHDSICGPPLPDPLTERF